MVEEHNRKKYYKKKIYKKKIYKKKPYKAKGDKTENILYEKNIYKALFTTAFPLMASNFIIALLDVTDTFFIGRLDNSASAQAAIGAAWPIINIMLAFNNGLAAAGVALISRMVGEENYEGAGKQAGALVGVALAMGAAINTFMFFAASAVMSFMGADGEVLGQAAAYLRVSSFEMIPLFIFAAFCSIRQSVGDMMYPVILSVVAAVANIAAAMVFINVLGMGIKGAAAASVAGQLSIVPFYTRGLFHGKDTVTITLDDMRLSAKEIKKLFKIAGPSIEGQLLASFGFVILQMLILKEGKEISAAFSIGNKISNIILAVVMALSTTMSAFVGQNIGAENMERAKRAYSVSRNMSVLMMMAGLVILFPMRKQLVGIMSNDGKTVAAAVKYIAVVLITLPGLALYQNYIGVFNGSGNTVLTLFMSFVWLWVLRIPMLLAVGRMYTDNPGAIWIVMGISNVLAAAAGHLLYRHIYVKKWG